MRGIVSGGVSVAVVCNKPHSTKTQRRVHRFSPVRLRDVACPRRCAAQKQKDVRLEIRVVERIVLAVVRRWLLMFLVIAFSTCAGSMPSTTCHWVEMQYALSGNAWGSPGKSRTFHGHANRVLEVVVIALE